MLRNSSREIFDCLQIVIIVDAFILLWFGIVNGVLLPSKLFFIIEI